MKILLIDIGGTNIKYALADEMNKLSEKGKTPTEAKEGADRVYLNLTKIIDQYIDIIDGIAISSAGQVDSLQGKIVYATKSIPGYTGYPLKEKLEQEYEVFTTVENDVNASALGEMWQGEITDDNFIALTIGTGIGGAIVIDNKIYQGASYSAGEIGHISLEYQGVPCNCGNSGCFERYASAQALEKQIADKLGEVDIVDFFEQCKSGNEEYSEVFNQWIDYLTEGLKTIVHIFNPNCILIGGGITIQGDFLERAIQKSLDNKIMPSFGKGFKVKLMTLRNDANLFGALYHHLQFRK